MATRVDPDGHHFVVLYVSINKKAFFVSEVATNKIGHPFLDGLISWPGG